ncbi:hypothetical protein [Allomuricauda sp. SCSIO 65647]|uniref:hypothetical protein n=1 Tax=Allomuricauda sp. SCSIO 65647 TaxID=2908843 RepID=UPI001F460C16|nr:hypothetical protein [Muricauda sp. SCSIO 65647]UJH66114.1 hypothetical protein L0P89_09020 [Muricauda sp. SCSIO 65647]
MKNLLTVILALVSFYPIMAQPKVYSIEPVPNDKVAYSGNLSEGMFLDDLSWAWSSANACFPETQKQKFTGKHLFFTGIIPKYSELTVTVIPKDTEANFSLYAYEIGSDSSDLAPDLPSCIRCEADHKRERNFKGSAPQDHTRLVKDLVAINTPYRVVIGVTGADGLGEGEFTLVVETKSR